MPTSNPYQPPSASDYANAESGSGAVTQEVVTALRETKPWVTFLAVLGFIGAGFMVLGGMAMLAFGSTLNDKTPPALGLMYILFAALYVLPSTFLIRYSSSIGRLLSGQGEAALIEAMRNQKSFWRTSGIMALVVMALMVLMIVLGAAGALFLRR